MMLSFFWGMQLPPQVTQNPWVKQTVQTYRPIVERAMQSINVQELIQEHPEECMIAASTVALPSIITVPGISFYGVSKAINNNWPVSLDAVLLGTIAASIAGEVVGQSLSEPLSIPLPIFDTLSYLAVAQGIPAIVNIVLVKKEYQKNLADFVSGLLSAKKNPSSTQR